MKQRTLRACAVLVVATALAIGCSSDPTKESNAAPPGAVVSEAAVGPSGGTLNGDGVTLSIPAGALASDQHIQITRSSDAPPAQAIGALYRFAPDGLTFAVPVRVTFSVNVATPDAVVFWSSPSGYEAQPSEVSGSSVAASIGHFSSGFVGRSAARESSDASAPTDATSTPDASDASNSCTCPDAIIGMCCNGSCVSTATNPVHCGGCNNTCPTGASCINSTCTVAP